MAATENNGRRSELVHSKQISQRIVTQQTAFELDKTPLAEAYCRDIRDTILRLAARQLAFTPDEVRAALHPLTREKLDEKWPNGKYRYANAIGAEFKSMAHAGLIAKTNNYVRSISDRRRGGMCAQWRAA